MKKYISAVAIFLVLAMAVLSLSSCANLFISEAALASISERILEGVNKISSAKALDADMDVLVSVSHSQLSFISIEIPVNVKTQFNVADKNNPSAYFSMNLLADFSALQGYDLGAQIIGNPNINADIYYSDGTMYVASDVTGETDKRKSDAEPGEFSDFVSLNMDDMHNLVFFDEDMIKSASLHNGSDGSLTATVTVDSKKALKSFLIVLTGVFSDNSKASSVSDEDISAIFDESGMDIGDAKISITVDKDNNVTNFKISGELSVTTNESSGASAKIRLSLDANFNPVGDDFEVKTPDDPEAYIEDKHTIDDDDDYNTDGPKTIYTDNVNGITVSQRDNKISVVHFYRLESGEFVFSVIKVFPESDWDLYLNSDGSPKQSLLNGLN